MITAGGLSPKESDESANWKFCADIYKTQTGKDAEGAQQIIKSADGKNILDEHGTISDACQLLWFFHDIGDQGREVPQQQQLGEHRQHVR